MFNLKRRSGQSKCSLELNDFILFLGCIITRVSSLSNVKPLKPKYLTTEVV